MIELIKEKEESIKGCLIIQNRGTRIRGMCKLLSDSVKFQSDACLLPTAVRCASEICHSWYWKVSRQDAERILRIESPTHVGNFCIRPRTDLDRPYALSYVSQINTEGEVELIEHFYIYWHDEIGFYLDNNDPKPANLLTLKYVFF